MHAQGGGGGGLDVGVHVHTHDAWTGCRGLDVGERSTEGVQGEWVQGEWVQVRVMRVRVVAVWWERLEVLSVVCT